MWANCGSQESARPNDNWNEGKCENVASCSAKPSTFPYWFGQDSQQSGSHKSKYGVYMW